MRQRNFRVGRKQTPGCEPDALRTVGLAQEAVLAMRSQPHSSRSVQRSLATHGSRDSLPRPWNWTTDPNGLRGLVIAELERHMPADQFAILKAAEEPEHDFIEPWRNQMSGDG